MAELPLLLRFRYKIDFGIGVFVITRVPTFGGYEWWCVFAGATVCGIVAWINYNLWGDDD